MNKTILINTIFLLLNILVSYRNDIDTVLFEEVKINENKESVTKVSLINSNENVNYRQYEELVLNCRKEYYNAQTSVDKVMAARLCAENFQIIKNAGLDSVVMNNFLEKNGKEILTLLTIKFIQNDYN